VHLPARVLKARQRKLVRVSYKGTARGSGINIETEFANIDERQNARARALSFICHRVDIARA